MGDWGCIGWVDCELCIGIGVWIWYWRGVLLVLGDVDDEMGLIGVGCVGGWWCCVCGVFVGLGS